MWDIIPINVSAMRIRIKSTAERMEKNMKLYFAPMEGITGYLYRNAHARYFGGVDKYFMPFLSPNKNHKWKSRERNDFMPEHNRDLCVVPQILTNRAEDFLWALSELEEAGYPEVNLNLGCPARTVVSKGKGAGFLARREELNTFLDKIFSAGEIGISAKIRLGMEDPWEILELIPIFNQYPWTELIIHPRVQKEFYRGKPHLDVFAEAARLSRAPVCYNGDLFSEAEVLRFQEQFPSIGSVMMGRGLLANPGLARKIQTGEEMKKDRFREFHDAVYHGYQELFYGDRNVLFKMKELWCYMIRMFSDPEAYAKKIKKVERFQDYEAVIDALFTERKLRKEANFEE